MMMNASDQVGESSFHIEPLPFKVMKIFLYAAILIFGTVGNTVVILIVLKGKYMKKTPGNLFILNLAVCDLLTPLISIPFDVLLVETNYTWYLGPTMCKVIPSLTTFVATSSPLTLAAIALDRYKSLLHPFKRRLNARTVKLLIALVHVSSGILVLPHFFALELSPSGYCEEVWSHDLLPKIYTLVLFLGQYVLPLTFMTAMYIVTVKNILASTERARSMSLNSKSSSGKRSVNGSRNNSLSKNGVSGPRADISHESLEKHFRKESELNAQVTKMFIVIVLVFAAMTLPLEVLWIWMAFGGGYESRYQLIIAVVCRLFTYANSCINPAIFYKLSRDFHKGFLAVFNGAVPCCGNAEVLERSHLCSTRNGFGSWDRLGIKIHTPSWLTLRGSFQSNNSTGFVEQERVSHITPKLEHKLSVPLLEQNFQSKSAVEMITETLVCEDKADQMSDKANLLKDSGLKASEPISTGSVLDTKCKISFNSEDDVTMDMGTLDSLVVLPQTDC